MRITLSVNPGLVSDDTTFSTPGYYADGSNVRFWRGKPQVIGGWSRQFPDALTGVCRNMRVWTDLSNSLNLAFGTHSKLQVWIGGTLYDITPSGLPSGTVDGVSGAGYGAGSYGRDGYSSAATADFYPRTWSLANWGQNLLASPRGKALYIWENDTLTAATEVTQAPDQIASMLVSPERQVLAFGCNEEVSGIYNPLCIRGSDIEDYTDWTTSPDNNAFEHILEGAGQIIAARMLGSYVAVWTDSSVYLGQFVGSPGQTYRFDLVAQNCGLIGPNAVVVVNQTAYWITPGRGFYAWTVGNAPAPVNCPIRKDFADNLSEDQTAKIIGCPVSQWNEVWWFYPDTRDGNENSRYVALSTSEGTWFRGMMGRTAAIDAGILTSPSMVDASGGVYSHETGASADGGAMAWFLETSDQYLDAAQQRMMVRGVWPDFEDQIGPVSLTINMRNYPQASTRTKGPFALPVGQGRRDFLADGRIVAVRYEGNSAPAYARFGALSFDVVGTGQQ